MRTIKTSIACPDVACNAKNRTVNTKVQKISRVNLCNLSSRDLLDNFILSDYLSGTAKRSNGVIVPDTKDSPYLSALDF